MFQNVEIQFRKDVSQPKWPGAVAAACFLEHTDNILTDGVGLHLQGLERQLRLHHDTLNLYLSRENCLCCCFQCSICPRGVTGALNEAADIQHVNATSHKPLSVLRRDATIPTDL